MSAVIHLAALQAARDGWPVYPVRPASKAPYFSRWQDLATTDPRTIALWFDGFIYPDAGLGAIPPARVVRVDVDVRHGGNGWDTIRRWERAGYELPVTLTAGTPSGGSHLYYTTGAVDLTSAFVGPNVELKVGATLLPPTPGYAWRGFGDERPVALPKWFAAAAVRAACSARNERARAGSALTSSTLDELAWQIERITGQAPQRTGGGGLRFRCPVHDDRRPSAWAVETPRGIRVLCSAGCPPASIVAALEAGAS